MLIAILKTYEKVNALEKTVASYLRTSPRPERLMVFDDSTTKNSDAIRKIIGTIPEAIYHKWRIRKDHATASPNALRMAFADDKIAGVMILDHDTLFAENWWDVAQKGYEDFKGMSMWAGLTLFNITSQHPAEPCEFQGYVKKQNCGGLGYLVPRRFWERVIVKVDWEYPSSWDLNIKPYHQEWNLYATEKSYLQHFGKSQIPNTIESYECHTNNFVGEE